LELGAYWGGEGGKKGNAGPRLQLEGKKEGSFRLISGLGARKSLRRSITLPTKGEKSVFLFLSVSGKGGSSFTTYSSSGKGKEGGEGVIVLSLHVPRIGGGEHISIVGGRGRQYSLRKKKGKIRLNCSHLAGKKEKEKARRTL